MSEPARTTLREELDDLLDRAWARRMGKQLEELAKASTLSDAEADAMLERARREVVAKPAGVRSLDEARAAKAAAKRGRPAWLVPLAVAAAALLIAGGATYEWTPVGRQIDARLFPPAPTETPKPPVPPTHEETPQEKAAKLRDQALVDAKKGYIGDATDELDAADQLDPRPEDSEQVKATRQLIHDAKPRVENFAKPPTGKYERPLVPLKKWHLQ